MSGITHYFNDLDDPRTGNAARHKFCDIMTISLLCALCGGETAVDMADFAHSKEDFLREFLELPAGPPCHDTFSRIFRQLKPSAFQRFFDRFRAEFRDRLHSVNGGALSRVAIAFDGKEMRGSFDHAARQSNLNVVTAWAHETQLSLGMITSGKAGGEIRALRELISLLDMTDTIVTADALHCQRASCDLIVQAGGDYCLQLKGNQGDMLTDIKVFIDDQHIEIIDKITTIDAQHGRIEE